MAKIYGTDKKEVIKYVVREITAIQCDKCGKLIQPQRGISKTNRYFDVNIHHSDWGNDSVDSYQYYHLCPECLNKFIAGYIEDIRGTECLEFETCYLYAGTTEEVDVD